ncbi:MAG: hypothetical protein P9L94_09225 [Candidatus Hinthialibacter antarcticus]|nr:hypothetical protein [Candidatus Hinthialibacter antarcticus]
MNDYQPSNPNRRLFIQKGLCVASMFGVKTFSTSNTFAASTSNAIDAESNGWNPERAFHLWGKPLRIQPILQYKVAQPREMTSWRSWGGVLDDESANEEAQRIQRELSQLKERASFPIEILDVQKVKTEEEAGNALKREFDLALVYPASGSGQLLQACVPDDRDALLFVRHRSGPTYYWYEALSVDYLQTDTSERKTRLGKTHVDDVVVDDYDELLWRLRSCYAIRNMKNSRIVAVGGPWGKYAADAPDIARKKYGIEIIDVGYDHIEPRIQSALKDTQKVALAEKQAAQYLNLPNTKLQTDKQFVVNAFLLYGLFKELMIEADAPAFTIKECMSTIIPMAKTTACLTLGLLCDEGVIAFCESDFVVIPAGILVRHIVDAPVFLHNSTFPHQGTVTCAHCSAPRRMNGSRYEPTTVLTHEESDYGAAPKVEIPIGQELSFISPEYTTGRWVGFRGNVIDNPFLPICRSQQDVHIQGNWKQLLNEVRDSHWLMCYGDHLKEIGFAARKLDIQWDNITDV